MSPEDIFQSLTPAQCEAVRHVDGPLLILAGPGSGKTRVITHRIAHLLEKGAAARDILALTFTNKAADEMRRRVETLAPDRPVWIGTFHRFCASLLRSHARLAGLAPNYSIYDAEDSLRALKRTIREMRLELTHFSSEQLAHEISWAKNNLITADDYRERPGNPLGVIVKRVFPAYQQQLTGSNAADFDDLLLLVATLLRKNPELRAVLDERYRYILVDEYQDTNLAQYAIVRALSIDHPNLAVTGDPDQSIYGWRGANLNNILEFERDYPNVRVVRLEQNWRSTKNILHVADRLISNNVLRKTKALYTGNDVGRPVRLVHYPTQQGEADTVAAKIAADVLAGRRRPQDFAVFYRVNALSRSFELALRRAGVPYQVVSGVEFFQRKEIKDVLAYLTLLNNPSDDVAFRRVVNTPARGIGSKTLRRLGEHAGRRALRLLEAARDAERIEALGKRPAAALRRFVALYDRLAQAADAPVEELIGRVMVESGYQAALEKSATEEAGRRQANLGELLTAAREFDRQHSGDGYLEAFLEQVSLVTQTDDWDEQTDKVTLMTLHAAKGLEFPAVFIVGVEQGLLPHERAGDDARQLEEERRLLFVGITRAEEQLELSLARYRGFRGALQRTIPSSFLMELPRRAMEVVELDEAAGGPPPHEQPIWDDAEFVQDAPQTPTPAAGSSAGAKSVALTTAADMLAGSERSDAPARPDAFYQGMVVTHPDYGPGKVIALGGEGDRRTATVQFITGAGQKKFVIAKSPLRAKGNKGGVPLAKRDLRDS